MVRTRLAMETPSEDGAGVAETTINASLDRRGSTTDRRNNQAMSASQMPLALEREPPPLHQDADGVIRIAQTRVTLESVISLFEQGASAEEIALRYDMLNLQDLYATIGYFLGHPQETQAYLERARKASVGARRDARQRSPTVQIRERLSGFRNRAHDPSAS